VVVVMAVVAMMGMVGLGWVGVGFGVAGLLGALQDFLAWGTSEGWRRAKRREKAGAGNCLVGAATGLCRI
jgi:hypothetical protein